MAVVGERREPEQQCGRRVDRPLVVRGRHGRALRGRRRRTRGSRNGFAVDDVLLLVDDDTAVLDHLAHVDALVRSGVAESAALVTGGIRGEDLPGYFYRPTVFTGVRDDMRIAREEIFGPVLSVLPYDDEDEAIARAYDTEYGLAAAVNSVWTSRA
ncbi:aldehyde dehydrogenase family protein [Streptomyces sp. LZ34]